MVLILHMFLIIHIAVRNPFILSMVKEHGEGRLEDLSPSIATLAFLAIGFFKSTTLAEFCLFVFPEALTLGVLLVPSVAKHPELLG
jgi:hypothetical protein